MTEKKVLIGLCGAMRSGKDSVFHALCEAGINARRFAFADPLKEELAAACGVTPHLIGAQKDRFRLGLQWWGTEFRRQLFGQDYWLKKMANRLDCSSWQVAVITDVRFQNEVDFVRQRGGVIWEIKRPRTIRETIKSWFAWKHASEQLRVDPDARIINNGTLADLNWKVLLAWGETVGINLAEM